MACFVLASPPPRYFDGRCHRYGILPLQGGTKQHTRRECGKIPYTICLFRAAVPSEYNLFLFIFLNILVYSILFLTLGLLAAYSKCR